METVKNILDKDKGKKKKKKKKKVKFAKDITPPVNGYYFNCEFNMKIEVDITGIILNRNKYPHRILV